MKPLAERPEDVVDVNIWRAPATEGTEIGIKATGSFGY